MMNVKPLLRTVLLAVVSVSVLSIVSCKKDDPMTDPGPGPYEPPVVSIDKTSGYVNEVLTINFWEVAGSEQYMGDFNGQSINVYRVGATLNFVIPNVAQGSYPFNVTVDGKALEYSIQVLTSPAVGNADQVIQEFQTQSAVALDSLEQYLDRIYGNPSNYPSDIQQDMDTWAQIETEAQQALGQMSTAEKEELAALLLSNEEWINEIGSYLINETYNFKTESTAAECKAVIASGRLAQASGEPFKALGLGISAYWCGLSLQKDNKTDNTLGKASTLVENTENQFIQITLTNLIGQRIDQLSKEVEELFGSASLAEEIEDADADKVEATLDYCDGQPQRVFAEIRFRSLRSSDTEFNTPYAPYANFYANFIAAYQDYVATLTEPLVWRPEFREATRVEQFNRFLSIPQNSITNNKAILINTQITADLWEVIFATDEEEQQSFNYNIMYDDGHVQLQKTFSGTAQECVYSFGSTGPAGGIVVWGTSDYSQGFRYLEMTTQPVGYASWGCKGDSIDTRNGWVGAGESNTQTIVQLCGQGGIAARLCYNHSQNGYDDWFLPSSGAAESIGIGLQSYPENLINLPDSITVWTSRSSHGYNDVRNTAFVATWIRTPEGASYSGGGMDKNTVLPVYAVRKF